MRLYFPAWIIVAGLFLAHTSGILQSIGGVVGSVDTIFADTVKGVNFLKQQEAKKQLAKQVKTLHPVVVKKTKG